MKPFLSELFAVMFRRRTKNNTIKFARLVVEWTCLAIAKFGPGAVVEAINKVQAKYVVKRPSVTLPPASVVDS